MFTRRDLPDDLADIRTEHAARARVLETDREFETMPQDWIYDLAMITEDIQALRHPTSWVPDDAPAALQRTTGRNPAIGLPTDGTVAWTRQTDPPLVFVKPRAEGLPAGFRDFLIAEALLEVGIQAPETPICFFRDEYPAVHGVFDDPQDAFQSAAALTTAWIGGQTRETFLTWAETSPRLYDVWEDAGSRLRGRIEELDSLIASGQLRMPDATELACSAIKHDLALPAPFDALDVEAYIEQGAPFGRRWIEESL